MIIIHTRTPTHVPSHLMIATNLQSLRGRHTDACARASNAPCTRYHLRCLRVYRLRSIMGWKLAVILKLTNIIGVKNRCNFKREKQVKQRESQLNGIRKYKKFLRKAWPAIPNFSHDCTVGCSIGSVPRSQLEQKWNDIQLIYKTKRHVNVRGPV